MFNKKSRIYGTSDQSDLSVYLSQMGADAGADSRERIREGIPEPLIG